MVKHGRYDDSENGRFAFPEDDSLEWLDEWDLRFLRASQLQARYGGQSPLRPACIHRPRCLLRSEPNGWEVWAGARFDCLESLEHFDVLLNLSGEPALEGHHVPLKGLEHWGKQAPPLEVILDWPDMRAVDLPAAFWTDLCQYLAKNRTRMLTFCVGGHGRTGTAICCLMVVNGWTSKAAIEWVRKNYCQQAVESKEQEEYICAIEEESQKALAEMTGQRR